MYENNRNWNVAFTFAWTTWRSTNKSKFTITAEPTRGVNAHFKFKKQSFWKIRNTNYLRVFFKLTSIWSTRILQRLAFIDLDVVIQIVNNFIIVSFIQLLILSTYINTFRFFGFKSIHAKALSFNTCSIVNTIIVGLAKGCNISLLQM